MPFTGLCIGPVMTGHHSGADFSIRVPPDQSLLAAPRGVSSLATPFIGNFCQDIHRTPFVALPLPDREIYLLPPKGRQRHTLSKGSLQRVFDEYTFAYSIRFSQVHALHGAKFKISPRLTSVKRFLSRQNRYYKMGVGGLEPPTSALSGPRSSQLS